MKDKSLTNKKNMQSTATATTLTDDLTSMFAVSRMGATTNYDKLLNTMVKTQ
jgi:hypothetical protein